ncbi:hypothetical protein DRJ19_00815 [Candidatus Woesearchaeota archaeon]|nr:MAG: hypothetical protein DRJ16_03060 [Candidatus Woesearchaeota archaeon]RLE44264.1 MAG: hypothetical protein DRJ19_00815 [Candidatus Woesearchaeota archaeon]
MLYRKSGFPEEDEIVLCTVTKIYHNSVFVHIDEYDIQGLIYIGEISPGRIRNIRDFVREGKKIVCKVLRADPKKGTVDLSLRRVNEEQRRKKLEEIKQEIKAERILEEVAKKLGMDIEKLYAVVSEKVFRKYEYLHQFFNDIVGGKSNSSKIGLPENIASVLDEVVLARIKPSEVKVKGKVKLWSLAPNGVELIKRALQRGLSLRKGKIEIRYAGNGEFNVSVVAPEYKIANKILTKCIENIVKAIQSLGGHGESVIEK